MFGTSALRTRWQSPPGHPALPSLKMNRKPNDVPVNALGIPKETLPTIRLPKRYLRIAIVGVLFLLSAVFFYMNSNNQEYASHLDDTRSFFEEWSNKEKHLPQHDPSLRLPEGRNGNFLWISNLVQQTDLSVIMQDMVIGAYVAHKLRRALVFENITLSRENVPIGMPGPVSMPASALLAGPVTGGYLPLKDRSPRAVSKTYFDTVCPTEDQVVLSDNGGGDILQQWIKKLGTKEERCIKLQSTRYMVSSSPHFLPHIWPELLKSPVFTNFRWSSLIHQAFDKNKDVFSTSKDMSSLPVVGVLFPEASRYTAITGLLVLHVPKIDQAELCKQASQDHAGFVGFNTLLDQPNVPDTSYSREPSTKGNRLYQRHCNPTIQEIIAEVQELRNSQQGRSLRNVHLITDADEDLVSDLKVGLRNAAKWDKVSSSRDLVFTREESYVAQAVEMMIAQRAGMFIGNGFSLFSSGVVLLRMGSASRPNTSRFW